MAVVRVGAVKTSYFGPVIISLLGRGFVQFVFTLQYFPFAPVEYVVEDFGCVSCWLKMLLISLDVALYSYVNQMFFRADPVCSRLIG